MLRNMSTKKYLILFAFLLRSISAFSQWSIEGSLKDASNSAPLEAVLTGLEGTAKTSTTDAGGHFAFNNLKPGRYILRTSLLGYFPLRVEVVLKENKILDLKMEPRNSVSEEVIVQATRSKILDPTTSSLISRESLDKVNLGQDMPILLQQATSVVSTSDAGAGVGYTGLSIRGSDATRINVTMNGIAVNDAESHGLFWVNMPDFASSVSSIQIQRGVGTSTNGSSAFGASLNIQTNTLRKEAFAEMNNSFGSFNTLKSNVMAGTGLIDGKWSVETRLSRISSDGFIDRGGSNLNSLFVSGGYYGKKGILKFNVLDGAEKTYQAWGGIPEARLKGNRQGMLDYISRNYLGSTDSAHLVNSSSRTYNGFRYKNQTDNYRQTHYQLFYSYDLGKQLMLNTALFYTKGGGYYEEFKEGADYESYGLPNPIIGTDTLKSTNLIRQRWLDNHYYGGTYSLTYDHEKLSATFGGSASQYRGDHFGKVIWAQNSTLTDNTFRYYFNNSIKNDFTNYAKIGYQFGSGFRAYVDMQVRSIYYSFAGYDRNLNSTDQAVSYTFINPKAGLSYQSGKKHFYYFSYGKSQREPVRDDFVNSSPGSRPKPEVLHNVELGWRFKSDRLNGSVNGYLMYYRNQLILSGQINDVGAYIRSNVASSYRRGFEMEASYKIVPKVVLGGNLTLSENRISEYNYFLDNYDSGEQAKNVFKNSPIAFSPNLIAASEIAWLPIKNLEAALIGKMVGRQYLDNTGSKSKSLNPYQFLNLRASYRLYLPNIKELSFQILVNNVLNQKYQANGYTYGYISGGQTITENFYFPQAGRNFLVGLSLKL